MILTYTRSHHEPPPYPDRTTSNMTVPDIDPAEATTNERLDALEVAIPKILVLLRYMDNNINMLADVVDLLMETPAPAPATATATATATEPTLGGPLPAPEQAP